jgi:hypothetical protein
MTGREETDLIVVRNHTTFIWGALCEYFPELVNSTHMLKPIMECESSRHEIGPVDVVTRRSGDFRIMLFVRRRRSR